MCMHHSAFITTYYILILFVDMYCTNPMYYLCMYYNNVCGILAQVNMVDHCDTN